MPASTDRSWQKKVLIEGADSEKHRDVVSFITSGWVRSASEYRPAPNPKSLYDKSVHTLARKIINAPKTNALLARDTEVSSLYYGFLVYEWDNSLPNDPFITVHYAYVKHSFRRRGIATELLKHAGWLPGMRIRFTHKCRYFNTVEECDRWHAFFDDHAYKL
jgi:hypothetical protein